MDFSDLPPRPKAVRCLKCKRSIRVKPVGRLPTFCSPSCRQMAFRRRSQMPKPPAPTRDELAVRIWEILTEFGLVTGDLPPSASRRNSHREPQDAHRDHRQAADL
jgi:hypothetical protein